MLADAATSILAILALVMAMLLQWVWADPAVGIVGSLVIASWAYGLIRDSGDRDVSYAFNDKESITADPTNANYAYAVWDRFTTPSGKSLASIEGAMMSSCALKI